MNSSAFIGRRLQAQGKSLCNGRAHVGMLGTTLYGAEVHFELFDAGAASSLWAERPLLGMPRAGAMRMPCVSSDLQSLRASYDGLHLEPLFRALRAHNGRRPFAPPAKGVALLVLADYANLFHQFGTLVIAWAALQESLERVPSEGPNESSSSSSSAAASHVLSIFLLNNATLTPTAAFWSPGLAPRPPTFVRQASAELRPATYARVVVAQPATESWWWNVWKADGADRRGTLLPLRSRLTHALLPPGTAEAQVAASATDGVADVSGAGERRAPHRTRAIALIVHRPSTADRRIVNAAELTAALEPVVEAAGLVPRLVDLGALDTRAQLALIQRTGLLVGAHGAGLLWNLFLPDGVPVIELLNRNNANGYYSNHARWCRRPYASWQNTQEAAESPALDPLTHAPFAPFRNHMHVNVTEIAQVVRRILSSGNRVR